MTSLSNFFKNKEQVCKCGHDIKFHYKKPNSIWKSATECNKCKCNSYLNRKHPDKMDLLMLGCGFLVISLFLSPIVTVAIYSTPDVMDKKIEITNGSLVTLSSGLIILLIVFFFMPMFIYPYFDYRKRKTYPIEKDEQK